VIQALKEGLAERIKETREKAESTLKEQIKSSIGANSKMTKEEIEEEEKEKKKDWGRVTVQADKEIDFLTIKKVLYTATEAGATLINFAVSQKSKDDVIKK
jgi:biopolymer transport protein ExbD